MMIVTSFMTSKFTLTQIMIVAMYTFTRSTNAMTYMCNSMLCIEIKNVGKWSRPEPIYLMTRFITQYHVILFSSFLLISRLG